MNKYKQPLFPAWSVGKMMSGNRGLSQAQKDDLFFLKQKSIGKILHKTSGNALKITPTEQKRLDSLLHKSTLSYHEQMNKTAKGVVLDLWKKLEYGYKKDLGNLPQIQKGLLVEGEILELIMKVYPEFGKLEKEQDFAKNKHFIGICDSISDMVTIPELNIKDESIVLDVKASSSFHSFVDVDVDGKIDPVYYGQLQVYMDLYNVNHAGLIYGLVNTPEEIIEKLIKKASWDFGGMETAQFVPEFIEKKNNIIKQNTFDHIPEEDRVRAIFFKRDEEYIKELKIRIEKGGWPEYDGLKLATNRYTLPNSIGDIQALLDAIDKLQ